MSNIAKTAISAAILASVALSSPIHAMPIGEVYNVYRHNTASTAALMTTDQPLMLNASRLDRLNEETARSAAQSYYDFDAIITLGTLAIAVGAFAVLGIAASRRNSEDADGEPDQPARNWRETVLKNLEADLTAYARNWRRAA